MELLSGNPQIPLGGIGLLPSIGRISFDDVFIAHDRAHAGKPEHWDVTVRTGFGADKIGVDKSGNIFEQFPIIAKEYGWPDR